MFFGILWSSLIVRLVGTYTLTDEQNLHTALLSGYNTDLRPGTDRSFPLNISASFAPFSIKEFDLDTGKFTLTGIFVIEWNDERLAWNLATYNQINVTSFPQSKIWLPNFININAYEDIRGLGSDLMRVDVFSSGLCSWYALQTFEVMCDTDVSKYPFDMQYCTLEFSIWGYQPGDIDVYFKSPQAILTLYSENGIWEIAKSTTHTEDNSYGYEKIIVGFHLQRRLTYYITTMILPLASIALLFAFVFLIPPESGERLGYSTTILLAIVVYLTIIQDMLPESSEPDVSVLSYILVCYVVSGVVLVILVIGSLRIQNLPSSKPVPDLCARFVIFCRKRKTENAVKRLDSKSMEVNDDDDDDDDRIKKVTWTDVGHCFDMICFLFQISIFIITLVIFFALTSS